jgi:hypothetical protein
MNKLKNLEVPYKLTFGMIFVFYIYFKYIVYIIYNYINTYLFFYIFYFILNSKLFNISIKEKKDKAEHFLKMEKNENNSHKSR